MKKSILIACLCLMTISANAQLDGKLSVWWGINAAAISFDSGSSDGAVKALNVGAIYSIDADSYVFDIGAGLITKGGKGWSPTYLQIDLDGNYLFVEKNEFKFGAFAGPYVGFMVAKDGAGDGAKFLDMGGHIGLRGQYRQVFAKAGFEYGAFNCMKGGKSLPYGFYVHVGYSF